MLGLTLSAAHCRVALAPPDSHTTSAASGTSSVGAPRETRRSRVVSACTMRSTARAALHLLHRGDEVHGEAEEEVAALRSSRRRHRRIEADQGAWSSWSRTPAFHAGDRRFESGRPYSLGVAQ